MKKRTILIIGAICFSFGSLLAQEATVSSGGEAEGTGGTASYSVGQVFYQTIESEWIITPGTQQSYQIYTLSAKRQPLNTSLTVFPNPTIDQLTLQVEDNTKGLSYQLYDLQGKLLTGSAIAATQTTINTSELATGTYIINIVSKSELVKSFKIIKH